MFLYHFTSQKYLHNILREGLKPKSKLSSFNYKELKGRLVNGFEIKPNTKGVFLSLSKQCCENELYLEYLLGHIVVKHFDPLIYVLKVNVEGNIFVLDSKHIFDMNSKILDFFPNYVFPFHSFYNIFYSKRIKSIRLPFLEDYLNSIMPLESYLESENYEVPEAFFPGSIAPNKIKVVGSFSFTDYFPNSPLSERFF